MRKKYGIVIDVAKCTDVTPVFGCKDENCERRTLVILRHSL